MSKIFCLLGKSASGKDTVFREVIKQTGVLPFVTYTTRPIRKNEEEGREYFFVDDNYLDVVKKEGKLIESRTYNTTKGIWTYFTADNIDTSKNYIIIATPFSFRDIKNYYQDKDVEVIGIYLNVRDDIRMQRAMNREKKQKNPDYEEICRRFITDFHDFANLKDVLTIDGNGTVENNIKLVRQII